MEKLIDVGEPESRHLMSSYEVVLTERERCARIAESMPKPMPSDKAPNLWHRNCGEAIAAAIRSGK